MKNQGFTLIELMIVVVIVAILAAVALPSYQDSVRKSRRADGIAALLKLQLAQEKFRANCPLYADTLAGADSCNAGTLNFSTSSEGGYYTIAITAAGGNTYNITADPQNSQASDGDCDPIGFTYPAGTKTPAGCWD